MDDSQREAMVVGLREAFGVDTPEHAEALVGGSAIVQRIVVRGRSYVLRFTRSDPAREFAAMRAAADIGVAPPVHYANDEARLAIIDFIEPRPWPRDAMTQIVPLYRELHALPAFPDVAHQLDVRVDHPEGELAEAVAAIAEVYPRTENLVAAHCSGKPSNLLYDGARMWLVDWGAAATNDGYVDLATSGMFAPETDHDAVLAMYLARAPTERESAMNFLIHVAVHVSYVEHADRALALARSSRFRESLVAL